MISFEESLSSYCYFIAFQHLHKYTSIAFNLYCSLVTFIRKKIVERSISAVITKQESSCND
jgi:hypothetical protein